MNKLKDIIEDSESLSQGLKDNACRHQFYNSYTSMERAMAFLLSGNMYITNGSNWNDIFDRETMQNRELFAKCFSCSTKENIAMWMLYGAKRGKQGAMLRYPRSVMNEIISIDTVLLGKFNNSKRFEGDEISKSSGDFDIFLTDVIYGDASKDNRLMINLYEDHERVEKSVIENMDIFIKNYAWSYERECRLVVKLSEKMKKRVKKDELNTICIPFTEKMMSDMRKRDLVRSPIYDGGVDYGTDSELFGNVEWNL